MFGIRLWLTAALLPLVGALSFLGITGSLAGSVLGPYELTATSTISGIVGELASFSSDSVDAAAAASANPELRSAFGKKPLSAGGEAALMARSGSVGAPSFALLVEADGRVVAHRGIETGLGDNLVGLPLVAESLGGVARDGLLLVDSKPFQAAAAPVFDGDTAVGVVVLGWPYDEERAARLSAKLGSSVVFVVGGQMFGKLPEGSDAAAVLAGSSFGKADVHLPSPLDAVAVPLPLLVDEPRFSVVSTPLFGLDAGSRVTAIIDRNAALRTIGLTQFGIVVMTLLFTLLASIVVVTTIRAMNKPLEIILAHLGQFHQGASVGLLPEAGLAGAFLRLGKQINMILQNQGSAQRVGTAPLSSLDGVLSSPSPVAPSTTSGPPSASPSFAPGGNAGGPDAFAAAPGSSVGMAAPRAPSGGMAPLPGAAAPLPGASSLPPAGPSGLSGLFDDDPLSTMRVPPVAAPPPPAPPPPPSGLDAFGDGAPAPEGNPEATVMFQVPQSLIEQSQAERRAAAAAPVPAPAPAPQASVAPSDEDDDEHRTVVAAVPRELLDNLTSPSKTLSGVDPAEQAHFREVYEKFLQTRTECGEDTSDLTFERFAQKLVKNKQQIVDKHAAKSVRFQVYVKDGKAALRALPVKT